MPEALVTNPAEIAAQRALDEMYDSIRTRLSFRLEAGAGAGKTYSLVKALKYVISEQGTSLLRRGQQVACITYTNVATDEIISRTDAHPVIHASTIHSFCWGLIKAFQPNLKELIGGISAWQERLEEAQGVGRRRIDYELGYRHVNEDEMLLHHDDVLALTVMLMDKPKFRRILKDRFPVLFIDEYQDTDAGFAASIVKYFIDTGNGPLIGLFGDSWQKIYRGVSGLIEHDELRFIKKEANFRSVNEVVTVLNKMRPDLPQEVTDPTATGSIAVYHSNNWVGTRQVGGHWGGDLASEDAHLYLQRVRTRLEADGWEFDPTQTKILMLTHRVLAAEQDYGEIVKIFRYNDSFLKKEDPHIAFLVDTIEPMCIAFENRRFGEMFSAMGSKAVNIQNLEDKRLWVDSMTTLLELRRTHTIGEVLDFIKETDRPRMPEKVRERELRLLRAEQEEIDESLTLQQVGKLREVPYTELSSLALFVNNYTPFSTKHGVKGAEFENVLVVLGRGWNQYNWNQFLEWFPNKFPADKTESYERNRNLFYVVCSRPRRRLALLFTQLLSTDALTTLKSWFGEESVNELDDT